MRLCKVVYLISIGFLINSVLTRLVGKLPAENIFFPLTGLILLGLVLFIDSCERE